MEGMSTMTTPLANTIAGSMLATMPSSTTSMGHGGMDGCKISMLWNWNTVGACFVSSTWKIKSPGMFAGSCIGVVLLVMSLEMIRRFRQSYDRFLIRRHLKNSAKLAQQSTQDQIDDNTKGKAPACHSPQSSPTSSPTRLNGQRPQPVARKIVKFRPQLWQQAVRALLHTIQFGVAYFIMLLAMYYNGFFILCILLGAFLGFFVFEFQVTAGPGGEEDAMGCCD